jgi:hypothetical protein
MFFAQEGFTYRNFLMDALAIFIFIVWFWLLITVLLICSAVKTFRVGLRPSG